MINESKSDKFQESIRKGALHQSEMYAVYKSSIGIINELRNNSKRYMNELSHVEDGLLSGSDSDQSLESNLALLTKSIESFNLLIGDACDKFIQHSEQMLGEYGEASANYEALEGQLSKLLEIRKQMLFILALIRKYKYKMNALQLMNNVLFSLSSDLKEAKDAYKSNIISVSTAMTSVIEQLESQVKNIENLN